MTEDGLRGLALRREQWRRGLHSAIPACCRCWFLIRDVVGWYDWRPFREWWWRRRVVRVRATHVGYVRCPWCLVRRRIVEVHCCTDECVGLPGACRVAS